MGNVIAHYKNCVSVSHIFKIFFQDLHCYALKFTLKYNLIWAPIIYLLEQYDAYNTHFCILYLEIYYIFRVNLILYYYLQLIFLFK